MEKLPPKANLRVKEVADFLDVSTSVVYMMINDGVFPSIRIGYHKRVPRDLFLAWYSRQIEHVQASL